MFLKPLAEKVLNDHKKYYEFEEYLISIRPFSY